jgi:hypothetical protein
MLQRCMFEIGLGGDGTRVRGGYGGNRSLLSHNYSRCEGIIQQSTCILERSEPRTTVAGKNAELISKFNIHRSSR